MASLRAVLETLAPEEIRKALVKRMVMLRAGSSGPSRHSDSTQARASTTAASAASSMGSAVSSKAHAAATAAKNRATGVAALYENETYDSLRDTIRRLDSSMQYKEYHTLRWSVAFLMLLIYLMYHYRDELKRWFGSTSADITSRTLGDESVQREAQNLAQGVVYQLLNDAHALKLTTMFLNELLEREDTRRAVLNLLASVAAREETQTLLHNLFVHIMTQPAFVEQTGIFVQDVLARESTMIALRDLFAALFADQEAQQLMADFFQHVINTDTFRNSVYQLGKDTTHDMLNNPEISQHAVVWVQDVLGEPDLHTKAGDAIWGAITSTFIPGFLGGGASGSNSKKKDMVNIDEAIESLRRERTRASQSSSTSNGSSKSAANSAKRSPPTSSSTTDDLDSLRPSSQKRSKVPPRSTTSAPAGDLFSTSDDEKDDDAEADDSSLPLIGKRRQDLSRSETPVFVAAEAAAEAATGRDEHGPK
ncbi:Hypothetical Protein FCC1311_056152 [Hondaea fermentalgiana]|uniref:Uncharacterized protein n=1 Tax=Hondaea fermentalgiana TaxID=2315210 RepID=A0A2R5GNF3_9STRA|nr:Hypothetical Protein FCC1311_056152 [Hondaea fermentalgiana]|eukprot:GBG29394.1 Hypothetical Protein FCC1311_056152 [Hondaea fermentalgiana]